MSEWAFARIGRRWRSFEAGVRFRRSRASEVTRPGRNRGRAARRSGTNGRLAEQRLDIRHERNRPLRVQRRSGAARPADIGAEQIMKLPEQGGDIRRRSHEETRSSGWPASPQAICCGARPKRKPTIRMSVYCKMPGSSHGAGCCAASCSVLPTFFPRQLQLTRRCVAWRESEVQSWMAERFGERTDNADAPPRS